MEMHDSKKEVVGITHRNDNILHCREISFQYLEDLFAVFLKLVSGPNFSNVIEFGFKILDECWP